MWTPTARRTSRGCPCIYLHEPCGPPIFSYATPCLLDRYSGKLGWRGAVGADCARGSPGGSHIGEVGGIGSLPTMMGVRSRCRCLASHTMVDHVHPQQDSLPLPRPRPPHAPPPSKTEVESPISHRREPAAVTTSSRLHRRVEAELTSPLEHGKKCILSAHNASFVAFDWVSTGLAHQPALGRPLPPPKKTHATRLCPLARTLPILFSISLCACWHNIKKGCAQWRANGWGGSSIYTPAQRRAGPLTGPRSLREVWPLRASL